MIIILIDAKKIRVVNKAIKHGLLVDVCLCNVREKMEMSKKQLCAGSKCT